jgi:hypothetical protein
MDQWVRWVPIALKRTLSDSATGPPYTAAGHVALEIVPFSTRHISLLRILTKRTTVRIRKTDNDIKVPADHRATILSTVAIRRLRSKPPCRAF